MVAPEGCVGVWGGGGGGCFFFFFKQKTAYEIVSRDWSSDVCSSDLFSRGKMVNRSYQLQDEISEFCHSHGRDVPEFSDSDFVDDFAFLVDMFNQLNELHTKLQGDKQLISDLYSHVVGGFHGKLKVWEDLFEEAFVDEDYFPTLSKRPNIKERCKRYMEKLSALREEFERRCADFKSVRSEEHTSELQSRETISYAVFCLKKKNKIKKSSPTVKLSEPCVTCKHRVLY